MTHHSKRATHAATSNPAKGPIKRVMIEEVKLAVILAVIFGIWAWGYAQ